MALARARSFNSTQATTAGVATDTRVFVVSLNGIPRVDARVRARLEAVARVTSATRRSYPQLITE